MEKTRGSAYLEESHKFSFYDLAQVIAREFQVFICKLGMMTLEVTSFGTVRTEHFTESNEFIIVPGQWDVLHDSLMSPIFFPSLHPMFNYQQEERGRGLGVGGGHLGNCI